MTWVRERLRDRAVLGFVSLSVLGAVFVLIASYTPQKILAPGGEKITAVFQNSLQLSKGDPVRVDGVKAGEVTDLRLNDDGRSTTVEMKIYDEAWPVYADARAWIRWRTLVGALFAIDLDRGRPGAGELGDRPISMKRTVSQVELEDIARVVRGEAQAGLRTMTGELSEALRDHDAPQAALRTLADTAPGIARGVRAVRGERPGDLRDAVRNTAATVRALDRPLALRRFVEGAGRALNVTARRSGDLRRTLRAAAGAMPNVQRTLQDLDGTLGHLDPLVADLREPAADVAPALRALNPTLAATRTLLGDARPLLRQLRPAARHLAAAARKGGPLVEALNPILRRIDRNILPDLALESPSTKHATYEMLGPTIAGLLAPFAFFDNETHFVRFLASGGEKAVDSAPCTSFVTDPSRSDDQLSTCQKAERLLQSIFQPGTANRALRKTP